MKIHTYGGSEPNPSGFAICNSIFCSLNCKNFTIAEVNLGGTHMKKCFKQYKQMVSAILVTLMALQPLGSLSSVAATAYDPDYVDAIVDEDVEWDKFLASPSDPASSSDWKVTGVSLGEASAVEAGTKGYTIEGAINITAASGSNWTGDSLSLEDTEKLEEMITVDSGDLFTNTPSILVTEDTSLFIKGNVTEKSGSYNVTVSISGFSDTVSVTVTDSEEEPPIDPSKQAYFQNPAGEESEGLVLRPNASDAWTLVLTENATGKISDVIYRSEDETVAVVTSEDGVAEVVIKAIAVGQTDINAYFSNNTEKPIATLRVSVIEESAQAFFDMIDNQLWKGHTTTAHLSLFPEAKGDISDVVYKSKNENVIAVLAGNGTEEVTLEAVGSGITDLEAYFKDNMEEPIATITVMVEDVVLTLSDDILTIKPGEEATTTLSAALKLGEDSWMTTEDVLFCIGHNYSPETDGGVLNGFTYDDKTGKISVLGGNVGNVDITFYLENSKVDLHVTVYEPQEEVTVTEGKPAINTDNAETVLPEVPADLPEGQDPAQLIEDTHAAAAKALDNIVTNTEIAKEGATRLSLEGAKPSDFNPEIPDIDGSVYPLQTVQSVEMDYITDENGLYVPIVKKVSYDISLYWKPAHLADNDAVTGMPLNNVNSGRFTFRIPVPSNIGDNSYANLKHDNDRVKQYTINKSVADNFFIEVTVTHFSIFELEFTNERITSGGGGGGGGGGNRTAGTGVANLSGNWILDANQRWWFSLTSGGYPANSWGRINNKLYYFDATGYMMTGWVQVSGKWYFLQPAGDMIANNWYLYNNQWYWLGADGAMYANQWLQYNNNWYYLNADGTMAVSTTTPDGYTVNADGIWIP